MTKDGGEGKRGAAFQQNFVHEDRPLRIRDLATALAGRDFSAETRICAKPEPFGIVLTHFDD